MPKDLGGLPLGLLASPPLAYSFAFSIWVRPGGLSSKRTPRQLKTPSPPLCSLPFPVGSYLPLHPRARPHASATFHFSETPSPSLFTSPSAHHHSCAFPLPNTHYLLHFFAAPLPTPPSTLSPPPLPRDSPPSPFDMPQPTPVPPSHTSHLLLRYDHPHSENPRMRTSPLHCPPPWSPQRRTPSTPLVLCTPTGDPYQFPSRCARAPSPHPPSSFTTPPKYNPIQDTPYPPFRHQPPPPDGHTRLPLDSYTNPRYPQLFLQPLHPPRTASPPPPTRHRCLSPPCLPPSLPPPILL